tara:strand:- start:261 stop:452 length:192 start_codon:yes stop_codon:yes gene_type:complete
VSRAQDRLVDFETRMLRRIGYLQEVDTARDVRLERMEQQQQRVENLLQLLVQQQETKQSDAQG